jgi:hypothetical protein
LGTIGAAASAAVAKSREIIQSALETIKSALEQIRSTGETLAAETIPVALEQIASGLDRLWSAGETMAAVAISSAIENLSFAFKNVKAATEAMASVGKTKAAETISSAVESIQAALEETRTRKDAAVSGLIQGDLARIESALKSIPPDIRAEEDLVEIPEALEASQAALEQLGTPAQAEAIRKIEGALATITSSVETMLSTQEAAVADMIQAALMETERPAEPGPARGMPRAEIGFGERLDQLAFRYYGDPALGRLLAIFNDVEHPMRMAAGRMLRVPSASAFRTS